MYVIAIGTLLQHTKIQASQANFSPKDIKQDNTPKQDINTKAEWLSAFLYHAFLIWGLVF
jgi:hypothetical protein